MVLVTGGTGLVGSHLLLRLCENDHVVRALYRNEYSILKTKRLFGLYGKTDLFENIDWQKGDIIDVPTLVSAFVSISQVYHCAALISFDPSDEETLRKINIEGTANIVNICLESDVKKLCYVSSIAALGDLKPHETAITEASEWNPEKPHSDYAISKYGAEMEIWRGQQEGLNTIIVNPGIILGAGFWDSGSGEIFSRLLKGLNYYTKGITGYVDVQDVTTIIVKLMKSECSNQRFLLVSENLTFEEVLKTTADALNVRPPKINASFFMTLAASKLDWFVHLSTGRKRTLSKDVVRSLHSQTFYSNEKVTSSLNYNFKKIEPTIKEIITVQLGKDNY